jgi:ATP-dependent Clp protease ATP-binding subunit ClpA
MYIFSHIACVLDPGTGKTTIARLVGLVLKKLGVLKKGHLVEVQRSDLVAGAIGQTALKTRDKINEARGGVLFVDEAYTLAPGGATETKDFGREAINEIMSVMNDGDPVVIFAGYKKEMETFVQANAGLFRRIDVRYDFENYSTLELAMRLRREVTSAGFILDKGVTDDVVAALFEKHTEPSLRNMMGGGLSRQLFRKARGKLDAELSLDATPEVMCTLSTTHLLAGLADITPLPSDNP